ncbi:LysR substrate-binding domain-containing protein [Beijerinckia sp. L45]|uniref:LysR substrate-binding domain-containing protein n=1 Tax=Beijerinckia sp. L45 TaxID=1641855 RepID=UPI00131D6CBD|nr:LysR substrate-binding domain-containing protein [Beijerinckia sp. L45]
MDLVALTAFNLVAAHGGFGRASRASGQSKTTLSRRVRELEDALGLRLIERGSRTLRLTEDGGTLHARTLGPLAEVEEAGLDVAAGLSRPRGLLRISCPVLVAHIAMGKVVAGFGAAFPDVQIELVAEDRVVDLVEDRYDVVIRINPTGDHGLVGRVFLRDETLLVAAPSVSRPSGRQDAAPLPAVLLARAATTLTWISATDGKTRTTPLTPRLRLSSLLVIHDAVRAGAGAASLVSRDLVDGTLVEWGMVPDRQIEAWVLHTSRRLVSPKVAEFVRFLCAAFPEARLVR